MAHHSGWTPNVSVRPWKLLPVQQTDESLKLKRNLDVRVVKPSWSKLFRTTEHFMRGNNTAVMDSFGGPTRSSGHYIHRGGRTLNSNHRLNAA